MVKVEFNDGCMYEDYCADSHNNWMDSYGLEDIVNDLLIVRQTMIYEGEAEAVYDDNGNIRLVETVGLKSIRRNDGYTRVERNDIDGFISRFHHYEHDVTETFTNGCCYYFALALHSRFPNSRIMLATGRNNEAGEVLHFVTEIDGREYDITGDVTGEYKTVVWDDLPEGFTKNMIKQMAILWGEEEND